MPIIDCQEIANEIMEEAKRKLKTHRARLVIISVGNDPASEVYVRNKVRACGELGVECVVKHLPSTITQEQLEQEIRNTTNTRATTGCILQLPLPFESHLDTEKAINCITRSKDVDGMTKNSPVIPCTPLGIMNILDKVAGNRLDGANAVIIGRSNLVGKPLVNLLTARNCTVTLCHSHTKDLKWYTQNADIVVVATGVPGLLTKDMVKDGAVVVDVGINRVNGKLVGDVAPDVAERDVYLTPVPGGVGKTTVAALMLNLAYLHELGRNMQ